MMQTAPFDYYRPESVAEAIDLLNRVEGARPIAGGHSLLPAMKLRVANPAALVDLTFIEGLDQITQDGDTITIGALTKHAAVCASRVLREHNKMLSYTGRNIGDPQVRNRGTIGGSIAHADPAADYPTVLTALEATINVSGPGGDRSIAAADFFVDLFTTSLKDGELVVSVEIPVYGAGTGGSYHKHRHPASSYAVVGVAAFVSVDGGTCTRAIIVVGGVTGTPERAEAAEALLVGNAIDEETITTAAANVAEALTNPLGDAYASGEYRVYLATVLARRALADAFGRAGA
jgi:aerobic carbon-monoxide dehydrogenase medium subunit